MEEAKFSDWHILIEGFKNVNVSDPNALFNQVSKNSKECYVQFFNADLIAGADHLRFAFLNALRNIETGRRISKNISVETLVFASAQRQISRAIEILGVTKETSRVAVMVISKSRERALETLGLLSKLLGGERSGSVIELTEDKYDNIKKIFNISDDEIQSALRTTKEEALKNLIIEHIAILAALR
ncbi:MAG: KEOPS complex subunit Cgi121 [Nitrososphaerota archaeon]|nr:KEOPS complex subunit Cgi121 [Candidatus Bathyarchaeota archaeon]MDW8048997.1 KEOPS complex subunit Cgi121 [Nitrososphaerota archaeon]